MKFQWMTAAAAIALALTACGGGDKTAAPDEAKTAAAAQANDAATTAARAEFDDMIAGITADYLQAEPEAASTNGAPTDLAGGKYNDRLMDYSREGELERREMFESLLAELSSFDPSPLDAPRRAVRDTLIDQFTAGLAPGAYGDFGSAFYGYGAFFVVYPVNQFSGIEIDVPNMLENQHTIANAEDADAYLARLKAFTEEMDKSGVRMKQQAADGYLPPDFILDKTTAVLKNFTTPAPTENVLYTSFKTKLEKAGLDEGAYLSKAEDLIANGVYPAYGRLAGVIAELRPQAVHDAGIWRLPHGEEIYQALIGTLGDSTLTADEIHELGLAEVARITSQMDLILKSQGETEGTVGARMAKLSDDPRFFFPNTDEGRGEILALANRQLDEIRPKLPEWFDVLPKAPVEVRRIPVFSEASQAGGYYSPPAIDGSRGGIYWINLRDTRQWPRFQLPTLTYHEAIPGHHLQISIGMESDTPPIKAMFTTNAFAEGWALYAEALAAEMGMYKDDPYGNLGRLRDELHRAVRLVVDTGMHAKRWSREKAIDYMVEVEGVGEDEATSEVERYAAWPGQALGYKLGMLKIQGLRKRAQDALGPDFDIREFHDVVLHGGGAPLKLLDAHVTAWIAEKQKTLAAKQTQ